MWFWWFMLAVDMLVPLCMILFGRMMWKHPPEKINGIIGYRTTRSMKNTDTWNFAHDYCGRLWWKIGWILLIPTAAAHIPLYHRSENTVGAAGCILCAVQCIILIVSIFFTERALKRNFTDEGERRK